jgi:hypothetical protein
VVARPLPPAPSAAAEASTLAEAQAALRGLAARLRAAGPQHAGLHDALLLNAAVRHWLAAVDIAPFAPRLANVSPKGIFLLLFSVLWGWGEGAANTAAVC